MLASPAGRALQGALCACVPLCLCAWGGARLFENIGNWLNTHFLALWPAVIGASIAVPAVVILYFLKLKRKEQVVSSTLLWRRVLEDVRVNAPFQRLKTNLLLLLQILILMAVAAALSRPFIQGLTAGRRTGFVLLIDNSASMSTRDCGGRTRLDAAREAALGEVERVSGDVRGAVIAYGARPLIVSGFTASRNELREAIERIKITGGGTDLSSALTVADGMAGSIGRDKCRLVIYSDAAIPENRPVKPVATEEIELRRFGTASDNVGITSLEARRSPGAGCQVFVRVANYGGRKASRDLRLFLGEAASAVDVKRVEVAPGGHRTVIFDAQVPGTMLPVRAELAAGDAMSVDDTAYAVLPPERKLQVLAYSDDRFFLSKALQHLPPDRYAVTVVGTSKVPSEGPAPKVWDSVDAVVFDRCCPGELPPGGGFLFIGPDRAPPVRGATIGEEIKHPRVVDWDRAHPLVRFTSLAGVEVIVARPVKLGRGQVVLLEAVEGPMIVARQLDQLRVIAIGFDVYRSNWPLRLSFPLFMANSVRWLSEASPKWAGAGLRCGSPLRLQAGLWREGSDGGSVPVEVIRPDGSREKLEIARDRPRLYAATEKPGFYRVRGPEGKDALFACAVLDEAESSNAARERLIFAERGVRGESWQLGDVSGKGSKSGREVWKYLALIALGVMVLEWYVYNRRLWG